ncbi:MFS general substrate transporter [Sphaerulina musiva SO2202]|uniref:MFS general substrate transporter n=1 Tax=Sphaerulina musiva (strain SO2202) TaxID=692275 RepID=M3AWF5_SPHMS|nr:MFS general substrate transporter [Sphaerulina musiva SO2202]EMF11080.1 MFS general substrate transporter [Sphaerulina musiva SO2202]
MDWNSNMMQMMRPYSAASDFVEKIQRLRSNSTYLVVVVSLSFFTDLLAYGVIVPVLPTALITRAGVEPGHEGFWISILLICESASALIASPIAGHLVDAHDTRKTFFLLAIALLFGSILWTALSTSIPLFILGRCIQGAATAWVRVSGFAMVADVIPEEKIAVTLGWLGAANTAGFTVGPVLGGVLFTYGGWWTVFGTLLGMLFLDFCLRCTVTERKRVIEEEDEYEGEGEREDEIEVEGENTTIYDHDDEAILQPTVPRKMKKKEKKKRENGLIVLARQPRMICMLCGVVTSGILISSFDATLPLFVQDRFHWDALGQGLIFLPTALPALLDPVYGYLINKFGVRKCATTAFLVLCPILLSLRFITTSTLLHKTLLITLLTLLGSALNVADVSLLVETDDVVRHLRETQPQLLSPRGAIAQSFGLQTMGYHLGVLLGPLGAGMLNQYEGWEWMTVALGALAGCMAGVMLGVGKKKNRKGRGGEEELGDGEDQEVEMQGLMGTRRGGGGKRGEGQWVEESVERLGKTHIPRRLPLP